MDNATYDGLCLTPVNTDETYSRLRTTQTNIKSRDELQRRTDIDQTSIRVVNQNKAKDTIKYSILLITMIVLLLIHTLVSIALSVATYSRSSSEQSMVQDQLNKTNNAMISVLKKLDTIESNNDISGQSNISQILNELDAKLQSFILLQTQYASVEIQVHCSSGLWHRLIYLNMSDPTHQRPFAWREYSKNEVRVCGRSSDSSGSCSTIHYFTYQLYSRVCRRVIGYQFATPDAFKHHQTNNGIDLDGINITRGAQHKHIWSYVAGETQNPSSELTSTCPCSGQGIDPPLSIINNYYCESGNPDINSRRNHLYTDDPLWDGEPYEGTCCTGTNSPPWFSVHLPTPTTDAIEVSVCCDQGTNDEDVPVELVEIYVQ